MSTQVMSACWHLQMPPTAKAVLVSLADNANDAGHCWPSLTAICARTCFGRTAVIEAIKWLEDHGAVKANRQDRYRTTYIVTPSNFRSESPQKLVREANQSARRTSSADGALVRLADDEVRQTDDEVRQADTNRQEPSRTVNRSNRKKATPVARPPDVSEAVWADWLELRRAKRAPVTKTVLAEAIREAGKACLSLERFLEIWCSRGSQGLQADWLKPAELARAGPSAAPSKHLTGMAGFMGVDPHDFARSANPRLVHDADSARADDAVRALPARLSSG